MARHGRPNYHRFATARATLRRWFVRLLLVSFTGACVLFIIGLVAQANGYHPDQQVAAPVAVTAPAPATGDLAGEDTSDLACWTELKVDLPAERLCGYRGTMPTGAVDVGPYPVPASDPATDGDPSQPAPAQAATSGPHMVSAATCHSAYTVGAHTVAQHTVAATALHSAYVVYAHTVAAHVVKANC